MKVRTLRSLSFSLFVAAVITLLSSVYAPAQRVRLRGQVTPSCPSGTSIWKFADIFAEGNTAVQGSYNCRGAFIYDITNADAPVLANWYNPGNNQQFLEAIIIGNRGYFGSGNGGGVHIVDLTNPYSPVFLGSVTSTNGNGFNSIHEIMVWNNLLIENDNSGTNLLRVINAKVKGRKPKLVAEDATPHQAEVVDLMARLRASLEGKKAGSAKKAPASKGRKGARGRKRVA